jgi:hypothetical protein
MLLRITPWLLLSHMSPLVLSSLIFFALSTQDEFEAFSIFRFLLKQIGGFYREQGFFVFPFAPYLQLSAVLMKNFVSYL